MRLAVLQTWVTGGGGCFQGTSLLEAVFRDGAAKLAELCGRGISPHCVLRPSQVHCPSSQLLKRNTIAFLWCQLPPAERCGLVCKGCTHMFPFPCPLPCSGHCSLTGLCVCDFLVCPMQSDETCSRRALTMPYVPLEGAGIAVHCGGGWQRYAVACMCVQWCTTWESVLECREHAFFLLLRMFSPNISQIIFNSFPLPVLQVCTSHFGELKLSVVNFKLVQSFRKPGGGKPVIG